MKQLHSYSTYNLRAHSYVMTMCDYMTSYTRCIMTKINQLNVHKSFETIEKKRLSFQVKSY